MTFTPSSVLVRGALTLMDKLPLNNFKTAVCALDWPLRCAVSPLESESLSIPPGGVYSGHCACKRRFGTLFPDGSTAAPRVKHPPCNLPMVIGFAEVALGRVVRIVGRDRRTKITCNWARGPMPP
jgi:hypothetical protein